MMSKKKKSLIRSLLRPNSITESPKNSPDRKNPNLMMKKGRRGTNEKSHRFGKDPNKN